MTKNTDKPNDDHYLSLLFNEWTKAAKQHGDNHPLTRFQRERLRRRLRRYPSDKSALKRRCIKALEQTEENK